MKHFYSFSFLMILPFVLIQFLDQSSEKKYADLKVHYFEKFDSFIDEVATLKKIAAATWKDSSHVALRNQLKKTRLAYKHVEFIFDYYETTYSHLNVNSGPLPKAHHEISEIDFVGPNGLQTLDELIFTEDIYENKDEIDSLANALYEAMIYIKPSHQQIKLSQRQLIESIRSGIVRSFTLGLTGFDTPGSLNGIEETGAALEAMQNAFRFMESESPDSVKQLFTIIDTVFSGAVSYVKNSTDFNSFDRLHFLRTFVNPLYKSLLIYQEQSGVTITTYKIHAHNYQSKNLFDEDFLDTKFYSEFTYNPLDNKDAIHLGKLLFNDPVLSNDLSMSCITCHDPKKAFTDNLEKSITNKAGIFTKRNSPSLIDVGYSSRYFWDLREYDLERQVAHVINDHKEFNIGFRKIIKRLNQSAEYRNLFEKAYGNISKKDINSRSISNAIAAYVNTLKSFDSPFDQYVREETETYPAEAKRGFNLFMGKAACGTCHFAPAFNGSVPPFYKEAESEVLGITMGFDSINPVLDQDQGRFANGLIREAFVHYKNSMKTVTVRNTALTFPYMHNGTFINLEEVVDFYDLGGGAGMGLDIKNQTLAPDRLNLTAVEKSDLISFLHTLTDTSGMTSPVVELPSFRTHPEWDGR